MDTPAQMGSCVNKGLVCHQSRETGETWCPRLNKWCDKCPKEEAEDE